MNIKRLIKNHLDDYQNINYEKICKVLEKYEFVSFDVFDTLIKRDVSKPTELFEIIEKRENITNFYSKRVTAEQKARFELGKRDVTLEDIYSFYDDIDDEGRNLLKNKEIEYEINICCCNELVYPIYKWCIDNKKKILVLSDMYLPEGVIDSILTNCGYNQIDELWISNVHNICKQDGSMYKAMLKKSAIKQNQIIHIGNSFIADYRRAKQAGINAIKIETTNSRSIEKYKKVISENNFDYKCLQSFINNHTKSEDYYKKFGYEAFGPSLYGFCQWVHQQLLENNCDTALFLGRDGYIMKQVYDELGFTYCIPSQYIEVSRRSFRIPFLEGTLSFEEVLEVIPLRKYATIGEFLEALGLEPTDYKDVVEKNQLSIGQVFEISEIKNDKNIEKLYEELKSEIIQNSLSERKNLYRYLESSVSGVNIGVVDVGWGGTIQHYMEKCFCDIKPNIRLYGLYWGVSQRAKKLLGTNSVAKGYFYNCFSGDDTYDMQKPFDGFFETLFLQQIGSVQRYTELENGKINIQRMPYEYDSVTANHIKDIQESALIFVKEFHKSFLSDFVCCSYKVMMRNLLRVATKPTIFECNLFGDIVFYDSGNKKRLIEKDKNFSIILNPKRFVVNYFNSYWKIGYLKSVLKVSMTYMNIYTKYLPILWDLLKKRREK